MPRWQGDAQLDDDGLAAGTIVTFRSRDEPADAVAAGLEETREKAGAARGEAARAKESLTSLEQAEAGLESELASTRSVLDAIRTQSRPSVASWRTRAPSVRNSHAPTASGCGTSSRPRAGCERSWTKRAGRSRPPSHTSVGSPIGSMRSTLGSRAGAAAGRPDRLGRVQHGLRARAGPAGPALGQHHTRGGRREARPLPALRRRPELAQHTHAKLGAERVTRCDRP
jgi:hypothetical protein